MNAKKALLYLPLLLLTACSESRKVSSGDNDTMLVAAILEGPTDLAEFKAFIDSIITTQLKRENIPGAAFVFVKDGQPFYMNGYGMANVAENKAVDPATTIFRIGSISKVFTADAILQLAAEKKVDLHADINKYLHSLQVPATFSQPITARHILTHTTGLDEIRPGTQGPDSASVQSLPQFLSNKMKRLWPPGEIIMYSTYGITLGGLLVEEVSQQPFEDYLRQHLWQPLGMNHTNINVPAHLKPSLAMGYEWTNGTNTSQHWEWYHTTPASSVNSTAKDMAQWIIAHLAQDNELMPAKMMQQMLSHQAGMHPGMHGMAYGFFEEYYGNLRFLYHGGNMAGFNSLVVLIPSKNAGFFFVSQHEGSSLRDNLQWAIMDRYYKNETNNKTPVISNDSTHASLFAGRYKYNVYCHTCPNPPATMTFNIKANPDGSIQLNNRKWIETTTALLFRRADGKSTIAFRADSSGKITHLSLGGYWTFEKIQ